MTFSNPWYEPHTVTFIGDQALPPPSDPNAPVPTNPGELLALDATTYVSSGFLFRNDTFQVSLPTAGDYTFYCIIHPGMQGTVTVSDDPTAATAQATMDAEGEAAIADALVQLKQAATAASAAGVTTTANADGTTTWHVEIGGLVGPSDLQQFFPPALNIAVGDTFTWSSSVPTPHTATFLGGAEFPVPPTTENEMVLLPTPAPASGYTGVGYVNSGIIGLGWPATTFSMKFAAAGSFPFMCVLHVDQGMAGVVNVTIAPSPETTGNAGLPTGALGASITLQLALLTAAMMFVAASAALTHRRQR